MYSPITIDKYCVFRQTFGSIPETLAKKLTVTGTLVVSEGEYRTLSQNQKISFTDPNIGNFGTGNFSVRINCKINNFVSQTGGTINAVIAKGTAETNGFYLGIKSDNKIYAYTVATGGKIYDTTINDGRLHDIIITRSGTSLIGYVDGIQRLTVTCSATTVNSGSFQIGGDSTTSKYINANYRLVELYNKALSSDEVLSLYNNSKFKLYNPVMDITKWIKRTGVYTETYSTISNSIVKLGQKIFTCGTAGILAYTSKWAYGTVEFSLLKGADANTMFISFMNSTNVLLATVDSGYYLQISNGEQIALTKVTNGVGSILLRTTASYIQNSTWYRIRITRTLVGINSIFTVYIKGGLFGNTWRVVGDTNGDDVMNGSDTAFGNGTNPVTDNTYTTSNFFVIDNDTGDLISDIRFYPYIITP